MTSSELDNLLCMPVKKRSTAHHFAPAETLYQNVDEFLLLLFGQ